MNADTSWLRAMRAESLAKIYLTRRSDLEVFSTSEATRPVGFDLLVRILGTQSIPTPEFGVEVKGIRESLSSNYWRSHLVEKSARSLRNANAHHVLEEHLPVCLFVFNIDTEKGVYIWLREPEFASHSNDPTLRSVARSNSSDSTEFEALDETAIDTVVHKVIRWYQWRQG